MKAAGLNMLQRCSTTSECVFNTSGESVNYHNAVFDFDQDDAVTASENVKPEMLYP